MFFSVCGKEVRQNEARNEAILCVSAMVESRDNTADLYEIAASFRYNKNADEI